MAEPARPSSAPAVAWKPQPGPQTAFLACPCFEILYGGARGGGKTDATLGEFGAHAGKYGNGAIGLMIRRNRVQLIETIQRSRQIYTQLGWKFGEQASMWEAPNGARLRFAYLERDADAEEYQGHSYTRVYAEELGNFPDPAPIQKLMATLRSGSGVPVGFRATANPGGPGQMWVRARYIDAAPMGYVVSKHEYKNPWNGNVITRDRVYIPARVTDNAYLGDEYVATLQMSGSPELVRAWLEGDWSVISGAYFPEFKLDRHVVAPIELPKSWVRFRSMDWGSYRPSAVLWFAVSDGTLPQFPAGALVCYRELYTIRRSESGIEPNVGTKLTGEEMADAILDAERGDKIDYGVLDPAAWKVDGGPSVAERMGNRKVSFMPADNSRITGWDQVRARLKGEESPMLYVFATCTHLIRTLPALQHDENRPEDVDTDGEDHAGDALRYGCMSRPYKRAEPKVAPRSDVYLATPGGGMVSNLTWREMMRRRERKAREL